MKKQIYTLLTGLVIGLLLFWYFQPSGKTEQLKSDNERLAKEVKQIETNLKSLERKESAYTDTIQALRQEKMKLATQSKASKEVVIRTVYAPQIKLPDSLATIEIIQERLQDDQNRIWALDRYATDLEREVYTANKLIAKLDSAGIVKDRMTAAYKQLAENWENRYDNQAKIARKEKRGRIGWKLAFAGAVGYIAYRELSD